MFVVERTLDDNTFVFLANGVEGWPGSEADVAFVCGHVCVGFSGPDGWFEPEILLPVNMLLPPKRKRISPRIQK